MKLKLGPELSGQIKKQYESAMAVYPMKRAEVDRFCGGLTETQADCLKFLYAYMPVNDIVSYDVETIYHYVKSTLSMYEKVEYAKKVPREIFLTYVLSYRVNNENVDDSREILFEMLYPRVRGKGMTQAALEVNYWCYEKATYSPTDDRTIAPLGMMKAAKGRCGEESTFTVSALRSVGIPARQCYSPRWAHCDDNHAWVEVWADGAWHYMGACEPEPVLNKGWFTAAASKAMLVHAKAYSHFLPGEDVAYQTPIYALINSTPVYGECRTITVQILDGGHPKSGVVVHFQLVNYSELYSIYQRTTDQDGNVSFTTGLGDIYVCAQDQGRMVFHKMDVRQEETTVLDLKSGIRPEKLKDPLTIDFEMNPPREKVAGAVQNADWKAHETRFRACGQSREDYKRTFASETRGEANAHFLALAKGNQNEIRKFLADPRFEEADKVQILSTLRDKDFVDTDAATLAAYLEAVLPYKHQFPEKVYVPYLLAPRVADEMIVPVRAKIAEMLRGENLTDGQQVWNYLRKRIQIMPSYGTDNWVADAYGMLYYGMGPEASFPVLYVAVCRSLGIPARLNPVTAEPEYIRMDGEAVEYAAASDKADQGKQTHADASLTLVNQAARNLNYKDQFSLAVLKNGEYQTLHYFGMELKETVTWDLAWGSYRLLTALRQIDGSVSTRTTYFNLKGDMELPVTLCQDRTKDKLRHVPLPDAVLQTADGIIALTEAMGSGKSIVIFADPGMEPTEHLFQELLECRDDYNAAGHRIVIILDEPRDNATLHRVLKELDYADTYYLNDPQYLHQLHVEMQTGDERLPFAIAVDEEKNGLFAFANYNIRTAQTMLNVLK